MPLPTLSGGQSPQMLLASLLENISPSQMLSTAGNGQESKQRCTGCSVRSLVGHSLSGSRVTSVHKACSLPGGRGKSTGHHLRSSVVTNEGGKTKINLQARLGAQNGTLSAMSAQRSRDNVRRGWIGKQQDDKFRNRRYFRQTADFSDRIGGRI